MAKSYYEVLEVPLTATVADITRAYRILATKCHPDKCPARDKKEATERFISIQEAYEVLKDPQKRHLYDQGGKKRYVEVIHFEKVDVNDESVTSSSVLNAEDIERFAARYPGSDEEKQDVKEFYARFGGDVTLIFDYIPVTSPTRECYERLIHLINALISAGEIKPSTKYTTSREKLKKNLRRLGKKAEGENTKFVEKYGDTDFASLVSQIKSNQARRRKEFDHVLQALASSQTPKPKRVKKDSK